MPDPRVEDAARSINEILQDRGIRHMAYFQRVAVREARQVVGFLNENVYPDLLGTLQARLETIRARGFDVGLHTTDRLRRLGAALDTIIREGVSAARSQQVASLTEIASSEAAWQARVLGEIAPLDITFGVPDRTTLRSIVLARPMNGRLLREHYQALDAVTRTAVRRAINVGLAQGESVDQIVRRLRGTRAARFADGALQTSRHEAERIARTAANHVSNHARQATYEENASVVKGYQWVSTLDSRTCPECGNLDGKVFPVGKDAKRRRREPPAHLNCRCTTVPVLRSFREMGISAKEIRAGTRRAMDGSVPATMTYPEWLNRQSAAVQDEILGPTRGKMLRGGKSFRTFVDPRGRPLTISELETLEA